MSSHQPEPALAKIEEVLKDILTSACNREPLSISLKYKQRPGNLPENTRSAFNVRSHSFPGATPQEAWRFTVLFRILGLIHDALISGTVISKRNIYYKDPSLFKSQAIVDKYVDVFAYTFGLQRSALNVTAAAKGLVVGNVVINRPDGTTVSKGVHDQSTFRTLASSHIHRTCSAGNGIILTAKGYPDISTRSFLRLLTLSHPPHKTAPPIFALMDYDPDGIAIMSTYKHGSFNLSHENEHLNVNRVKWLGVKSQDIIDKPSSLDNENENPQADLTGLLRLSSRDRKKANKMLENSEVFQEEAGVEIEWRREMQVMLVLNVKAEMEVLAEMKGSVEAWVRRRLVEEIGAFQSRPAQARPWLL